MSKAYKFSTDDKYPGEKHFKPIAYGQYTGIVLGEPILREVEVLTKLLVPLFEGIKKPHSALYEIQRIEREEKKTGADLSELKEAILKCCPPDSTVSDSISFKPLRDAILNRIIEITGLEEYIDN